MSNIYIQEPPTIGKVVLVTSVGEIDIELWSKEAPRTCRNFVQLCMEGYYDGLIFHRIVKGFIAQGGDPTGTGHGGDSIYGKPFRDEFHSRLRFARRGLLAMANAGPNDNGSQFFFTFGAAPELNSKHTIFGKVAGDTLYNVLKLEDIEVDGTDRPTYPPKIIKAKVLANPFEDIVPRVQQKTDDEEGGKKKKSKAKATKNFKLLSFGDEAEEDEEETNKASENLRGKGKSSHDLLDDKKLSSVPAVADEAGEKRSHSESEDDEIEEGSGDESEDDEEKAAAKDRIRKKLKKDPSEKTAKLELEKSELDISPEELVKLSKTDELKREVLQLQRELKEKKKKVAEREREKLKTHDDEINEPKPVNDMVETIRAERKKYKEIKKTQTRRGTDREAQTLAMLEKFRSKINTAKQLAGYGDDEEEEEEGKKKVDEEKKEEGEVEEEVDDPTDMSWMGHKLRFEDNKEKKVLDANVHDVDRYDVFDPRNPLTKRRREASKQTMKSKR